MAYGTLSVSTLRLMIVSAALNFPSLLAVPPGEWMAPERATELRIRAAEIKEFAKIHPELQEAIIKVNPGLKDYLEGVNNLADLKPSELEFLASVHAQEACKNKAAVAALYSTLSRESSETVVAEVAKCLEGRVRGATAMSFVAGIMANRKSIAVGGYERLRLAVSQERIAELYSPDGAAFRLMTATFPDSQNPRAIRANNFSTLMIVERVAEQVAKKGEEDNTRFAEALRELVRMSVLDKDLLLELGKVVEAAKASPRGETWMAMVGLRSVSMAVEYAKSNSGEAAEIFARSVAGHGGSVEAVKAEVAANEAKLFDLVWNEIQANRFQVDLSDVLTMCDRVARLEAAIVKASDPDRRAALEELRDEAVAQRLVAAMGATAYFKSLTLNGKVNLVRQMLRAGGLRGSRARFGAIRALTTLTGATYKGVNDALDNKAVDGNDSGEPCKVSECAELAKKMTISEKLFSGE